VAAKPDSLSPADPEIEETLREVLGTVLPEDSHDLLLAVALERSRLRSLPPVGPLLRVFVFDTLHDVVESMFNAGIARQVLLRAARALDGLEDRRRTVLVSGRRPATASADARTAPPLVNRPEQLQNTLPAPRAEEQVVLLVSHSAMTWADLDEVLAPDVRVVATAQTRAVHETLRGRDAATPVVVDCREGVAETVLASLVPELPPDSHVILWGPRSLVSTLLSHVTAPFESWVHCDEDMPPSEVAKVVRRYL
jgi:hypothetical protein